MSPTILPTAGPVALPSAITRRFSLPPRPEIHRFLAQKHKKEAEIFVESDGLMSQCKGGRVVAAEADVSSIGEASNAERIGIKREREALSPPAALALQFRMYKKLLLWETAVRLGPPLGATNTVSANNK
jgi:hypothetical protein